MTPEERELLTHSIKLAEENNKILRGIRRNSRLAFLWKITYWIIIIGLSYGAYIYVQPYIKQLQSTTAKIQKDVSDLQKNASNLPSSILDLFK